MGVANLFLFVVVGFGWLKFLPELKWERLVDPLSMSLSSGRLRESPISGLGHVSMPASGGSAAIIYCVCV